MWEMKEPHPLYHLLNTGKWLLESRVVKSGHFRPEVQKQSGRDKIGASVVVVHQGNLDSRISTILVVLVELRLHIYRFYYPFL